jgi:hypothetical protein
MSDCFVIQPFDGGKFDKRFHDVFKPAIEDAGLKAYRVDYDPAVEVPIEAIEQGIRKAALCFADITTDNPNVWYELGFAYAAGTPVVMVCSKERSGRRFPFDVQHRAIIMYEVEAPSDFDELKGKITSRINAMLGQGAALKEIAKQEQIALIQGLTHPELLVLAVALGSMYVPGAAVSLYLIKRDVEKTLTSAGYTLALRRLQNREFARVDEVNDYNGDLYPALLLTEKAWTWIDSNDSLFAITRASQSAANLSEDESPF